MHWDTAHKPHAQKWCQWGVCRGGFFNSHGENDGGGKRIFTQELSRDSCGAMIPKVEFVILSLFLLYYCASWMLPTRLSHQTQVYLQTGFNSILHYSLL